MSIPLKLSTILLLAPMLASAADGMDYAAAYQCQADAINQDLVDTCSGKFPELTPSAVDAIASWRSRNAVKAKLAHDACETPAREPATTAPPPDEVAQLRQQMDGMRYDIKMDFQMRAQQEGQSACVAALGQLASGDAGMDFN